MVKKNEVYFCPRCESVKVGYVFRLGNLFGVVPRMECRDCGFSAMSFPILVVGEKRVSEKKVAKKVKKADKEKVAKKVAEKTKKVAKK